jgi:hypothetical protein
VAFFVTLAVLSLALLWFCYTPGRDHFASISLDGDGSWFQNYEPGFEIADTEVLWNGLGHSMENAQKADIIFLGTSNVLFGIDWRLLEAFERKHNVRIFNLAFAGIGSGEFDLRLIKKWNLHPKLWIIHADMYKGDIRNSFFYMTMGSGGSFGTGAPRTVVDSNWLSGFKAVVGRNIRWRIKKALGLFPPHDPYRSAKTGSWYLDRWRFQLTEDNATIETWIEPECPENSEEAGLARKYMDQIGGRVVLIQVPSVLACSPRIRHLADALGIPGFTVVPEQFSSGDGGGHLDRKGAKKYTAMLFAWLETSSSVDFYESVVKPHHPGF